MLFTANIIEAGEIDIVDVIITFAFATFPKLSVTLITADPLAAGAVYEPELALIEPVPEISEKVYGGTPSFPTKLMIELIKVVCEVGEIVKALLIVMLASAVAPKLSVTRTVANPLIAGAM